MKPFLRRLAINLARPALTLLIVAAALVAGRGLWAYYQEAPWTRDGRVRAAQLRRSHFPVRNERVDRQPVFSSGDIYRLSFVYRDCLMHRWIQHIDGQFMRSDRRSRDSRVSMPALVELMRRGRGAAQSPIIFASPPTVSAVLPWHRRPASAVPQTLREPPTPARPPMPQRRSRANPAPELPSLRSGSLVMGSLVSGSLAPPRRPPTRQRPAPPSAGRSAARRRVVPRRARRTARDSGAADLSAGGARVHPGHLSRTGRNLSDADW